MKNSSKKTVYFNAANFVQMVLKESDLDKSSAEIQEELSLEITQTLSDRITSVIINSLGDKEMFLLKKTLEDHPELDEIDALSMITSYIPGLNERILKEVSDLFEELVSDIKTIDQKSSKSNKKF